MHHTTQAIILKKVVYGEADLIVTFFGRQEGRISGIAKNARASQRRFGGALELGSLVNLNYVQRAHSDLVRIEDSQVSFPTTGIMQSLERIGAMSRALQLALAFLQEHQAAEEKFDLLANYIASLARSEPVLSAAIAFELKWLSLVGYQPLLENCADCGGHGNDALWFVFERGSLVCNSCSFPNHNRISLKTSVVEKMKQLMHNEGIKADVSISEGHDIKAFLSGYMEYILGRPLLKNFYVFT